MSANEANLPAISRGARALADKERSGPLPPLAPFYDGLAPLFLALKAAETIWNIVLRLKFDLDRPNGLSRNQALQALDDLQASGRLSRFHEAVAGARERANPGDIIGTLTAALSILSRACPPNFITGATYELGMIEASKGAVALAARDCVLAEDRRFRPPELLRTDRGRDKARRGAFSPRRKPQVPDGVEASTGEHGSLVGMGVRGRSAVQDPALISATLLRGSKVVATA